MSNCAMNHYTTVFIFLFLSYLCYPKVAVIMAFTKIVTIEDVQNEYHMRHVQITDV